MECCIEQGRLEAKQEQEREVRVDMLIRLMTRKFGPLTAKQRRRIERADAETLLRWLEQILFAQAPKDVFR